MTATQDELLHGERDIFGAHYDEARITSSTQLHPMWGQLAARSMEQYRRLEELSGQSP